MLETRKLLTKIQAVAAKLASVGIEYKRDLCKRQGLADVLQVLDRTKTKILYSKQFEEQQESIARQLAPFFGEQIDSAALQLKNQPEVVADDDEDARKKADQIVKRIFDPGDWTDKLIRTAEPILAEAMGLETIRFFAEAGIDITKCFVPKTKALENTIFPASFPDWMVADITSQLEATFGQAYWAEISQTTSGNLQTMLGQGLINGVSIQTMAAEISSRFPPAYDLARATTLARTEAGNVLNAARVNGIARLKEAIGPEAAQHVGKIWLSVLGDTTRDSHADLNDEIADENGNWILGGVEIQWPAQDTLPVEERANCQCTIQMALGAGVGSPESIEQALQEI